MAATGGMAKGSNNAQNIEAAQRLFSNGIVTIQRRDSYLENSARWLCIDAARKASSESKALKVGGFV